MKKAVPTTSQLELIKNFNFRVPSKDADKGEYYIKGTELDTDISDDFLKILDLLEQFYKLSKTTKFKYGKPVDQFDLNKVFKAIHLRFEPSTGIYYDPTFSFKPMGLSYLISFIMTVRHDENMNTRTYSKNSLILMLTEVLKKVKDILNLNTENVEGLPVITVNDGNLNYDVERFEEEESSGEGLSYLFDGSKVPFKYKDLSPHFTKYIVETISRQIRRMAKRGEIDAKTTTIERDIKPLLRGGKVIRRSKAGQPITAQVQVNFLRAVIDDLLYEQGGEDIVRQIASLDKNEFDEFMRNKKYNRSLTTIFTQFVNVAIKENLNKLGYYDVVAQRFRGDSSLVAKSNVTQNFFKSLDLQYEPERPIRSFQAIINNDRAPLRSFLRRQIPVVVETVELDLETDVLIVSPIFRTYSDTDSVIARTKFILDFRDERIYYSTNHYISDELSMINFKDIASSISMDEEDPLRDLITLLGQMTKPDEVSSRTFGGKKKVPEYQSLSVLKQFVNLIPKKNIVKIEGPEYNSLLGTITGGMLLGIYNEEGTILKSLTYLSFDSIRNRRKSLGRKTACMVRLQISREHRNIDDPTEESYFLNMGGSNCVYSARDLSTGDTVASVVGTILDSLRSDSTDYRLSGIANVRGGYLHSYIEPDDTEELQQRLTEEILKIPLEDMDEILFRSARIEIKMTKGGDIDE